MCDVSDWFPKREYVDYAWIYCSFFNTEAEGIKMLAEQLSETHVRIVKKAAAEELVSLGEEGLGYSTEAVSFVSREFVQALSQMKKVAST